MSRSRSARAQRRSPICHQVGRCGRQPADGRGEAGNALIFAVIAMGVIFLAVTALFGYARASSRSLQTYRIDRTLRYAADGALEQGVQMVKNDTTLGITENQPPPCSVSVALSQFDTGTPTAFAAGSTLTVDCVATSGVTSGGADTDGGQRTRDVTFTVTCLGKTESAGKLTCGTTGTAYVIASARVRYEPTYDVTIDPAKRTIAPKIVNWKISR